jgi:CRP-like cAMP-binding protein
MDTVESLRKVSLFAELNDRNLKLLAKSCTNRTFDKGEYLVKQNDDGIGLFVIISGKVKVTKKTGAGSEIDIATHGPGDFIGEFSVLDGAKRTASVVALEKTECALLTSWDFNSIMDTNPEIAVGILPVVVKRFRETNETLTSLTNSE